jgi:hypothetical protein
MNFLEKERVDTDQSREVAKLRRCEAHTFPAIGALGEAVLTGGATIERALKRTS